LIPQCVLAELASIPFNVPTNTAFGKKPYLSSITYPIDTYHDVIYKPNNAEEVSNPDAANASNRNGTDKKLV
jgi:hypothetical protein